MEYLFECLQANHLSHQNPIPSVSVFLFLLTCYMVTFKRSKLYALAFLVSEIAFSTSYFWLIGYSDYYGFQLMSLSVSMQCILFALILITTNSKSQRIICVMIVTLDVLMAIGYLVGGDAALYLYDNYENIVFCLHVMLILSLYKPKPILRAMEDKFCDFLRAVDSIIFMRAFWYTKEISKQEFKLT